MVEEMQALLAAGEQVPDWDAQLIRKYIVTLESSVRYMNPEEYIRFSNLCRKLRGKMQELMPRS